MAIYYLFHELLGEHYVRARSKVEARKKLAAAVSAAALESECSTGEYYPASDSEILDG